MVQWSERYPFERAVINRVVPARAGVYRLLYGPDIVFYVGQAQNLREALKKYFYAYPSGASEEVRGYLHLHICHFQFVELEDGKKRATLKKSEIEKWKPECNETEIIEG